MILIIILDLNHLHIKTTNDQSIEAIQRIAKNDTTNMYFGRYDYAQNISEEREKTFGDEYKV